MVGGAGVGVVVGGGDSCGGRRWGCGGRGRGGGCGMRG